MPFRFSPTSEVKLLPASYLFSCNFLVISCISICYCYFFWTHHRSIQLAHLFLTPHSPRWKGLIAPLEISCSNLVFCRILQSEAPKKEWQVWPLCCPSCKIISSSHPLSVLALLATFAVLVQNWKVELFLLFFCWSEVYVLRAYVLHLVDSLRVHPVGFFFLHSLCVTDLHTGFDGKQ